MPPASRETPSPGSPTAAAGRAVLHNRWTSLLFLHWRYDPDAVQKLLPPGLRVDTHDGSAWVGVVPFGMERIRPVWCPPVPWLSWFLEMNLRTYVVCEATGRAGVWFFLLDANRRLACSVARRFFHLPYHFARMRRTRNAEWIDYTSQRQGEKPCHFRWRPEYAPMQGAAPRSLEFFLVERYELFAWEQDRQRLWSGRVSHSPYQICPAEVERVECAPLFQRVGLQAPSGAPESRLYSPVAQTLVYPLRPAAI